MSDTVDILNAVKYVNIFQKLPNAINPKTKVSKILQMQDCARRAGFWQNVKLRKYGFYSCNFPYKTR